MELKKPYSTVKRNGEVKFFNDKNEQITSGEAAVLLCNQLSSIENYLADIKKEPLRLTGPLTAKEFSEHHIDFSIRHIHQLRQFLIGYFV